MVQGNGSGIFQQTSDYLIYIGAPAIIIVLIIVGVCIYMRVKANESKVDELEKIEDMHFNSSRFVINGQPQAGFD